MSKLHSAMVVYGAVDDAAARARDKAVIAALPDNFRQSRTVGDRAWSRQVEQVARAAGSAEFHRLDDALDDLSTLALAEAVPDDNHLTPFDLRRLYYFTGILDQLRAAGLVKCDPAKLDAVRAAVAATRCPDYIKPPGVTTTSVREVNGEYATVLLTTSHSSSVSLDQLKPVLYPTNWPKVSSFFIAMAAHPELTHDEHGWLQLMEVIGTGADAGFQLRTPLKFWMGEHNGSVFVNYDMVDHPAAFADSDRLVVVDNGYIVAVPDDPGDTSAPGVRLHTSKELLIRGMSPTAAANLADRLGWADAGEAMFFRAAGRTDLQAWAPSSPTDAQPAPAVGISAPPWTLPPGNRKQIIRTAQATAVSLLDSTARSAGELAHRWQNGITPEDIVAIGADLGDELSTVVESVFDTAVDSVRPAAVGAREEK
ncbi:hypothetical protein MMUR_53580 [Mycolicibacterium murale]|uniref:Uncharacterized protein n=1 Tax=Mycolicibacterium murale TaxID=182220 RepID=A0A7I9WTZ3_9MYCO|nr:hypothetical protein [Mycolicibacterium murale]MCV7181332.1 hypothetical protein [Mycolicibacterium murale]GFG61222.1 hypothetical protein MMUR_53580 [Mycolicibacterium murale]